MAETYISTREVAGLLGVTETTVKRWTESNSLKCVKTPGGHRKYTLKDIEDFARETNSPITGVTPPIGKEHLKKLGYAVYSNDTDKIIQIIMEESLLGSRHGLLESFMYLTKNRIKFINLIDEIIQPVMERIGLLWEKGELTIEQEHLASDTIKTALSRLVFNQPRQREKNIKIICACVEGEQHDIGLQTIAYELELRGYTLHYLGANTPFKSIVNAIKHEKPEYAFISATSPVIHEEDIIKGLKSIARASKTINVKLNLGGQYFRNFDTSILGYGNIINSVKEINTSLRT